MSNHSLLEVLHNNRNMHHRSQDYRTSDADLLRRYVQHNDESAFEVLLWRHGPMVLHLCRRILGDVDRSEDAFQATFLTLALTAGEIRQQGSLYSWLYKVAYRNALRISNDPTKREISFPPHEGQGWEYEDHARTEMQELREVLDRAIAQLPEPFRAVVVLCYLQGQSNSEAAQTLGCPKGTIDSRLARARKRLRRQLESMLGTSMPLSMPSPNGPRSGTSRDHDN